MWYKKALIAALVLSLFLGNAVLLQSSHGDGDHSTSSSAAVCSGTTLNVRFNEVYYDVEGVDHEGEYIELYNPTSEDVNIGNWSVDEGEYDNVIPEGVTIEAGHHYVLSRDEATFEDEYGFTPEMSDLTLTLNNGGDHLTLFDSEGNEVDRVGWEGELDSELEAETGRVLTKDDSSEWTTEEPNPAVDDIPGLDVVAVEEVVDADTVKVEFSNGTTEYVRILGIDSPETSGSEDMDEWNGIDNETWLRRCGNRATNFTERWLEDEVTLIYDDTAGKRGYYGRLLAYVELSNGTDLGSELLSNGLARVYDNSHFERKDAYLQRESNAVEDNIGIWSRA